MFDRIDREAMKKIIRPTRYRIGAGVSLVGAVLAILSIVQEVVDIGLADFPVRGPATMAIVVAGAGLVLSSVDHSDDESEPPQAD